MLESELRSALDGLIGRPNEAKESLHFGISQQKSPKIKMK